MDKHVRKALAQRRALEQRGESFLANEFKRVQLKNKRVEK